MQILCDHCLSSSGIKLLPPSLSSLLPAPLSQDEEYDHSTDSGCSSHPSNSLHTEIQSAPPSGHVQVWPVLPALPWVWPHCVRHCVWYDRADLPTEEQMCTVGYDRDSKHREDVLQYNLHFPDSLEEEIYLLRIWDLVISELRLLVFGLTWITSYGITAKNVIKLLFFISSVTVCL